MSNIKIRNMELPQGCFFCPLMVKADGDFYKCPLAGFKYPTGYYYEHADKERNPLCPLEALPDGEETDAYLIERFGMTVEAISRVMKNHRRIVNSEAHEVIEHLDYYMNPTDYVDEDMLPEDWDDNGEADGYPALYTYARDLFGEDGPKVFKDLISWGTTHGGMGSACEAVDLIRIDAEDEAAHDEEGQPPHDCPWG